jgi:hypothetical protein
VTGLSVTLAGVRRSAPTAAQRGGYSVALGLRGLDEVGATFLCGGCGGTVRGPELNGSIVAGGVDWQTNRCDGVLEIAAHYVARTDDGALVEIRSDVLRHGPPR